VRNRTKQLIAAAMLLRAKAQRLRAESIWLRAIHDRRFPDPKNPSQLTEEAKQMSAKARKTALELKEQEQARDLADVRRRNGLPENWPE
jgi:hypothetical protein